MPDFDLAVIGAGAAGLSVTAAAAQLGLRVALLERGRMGGECLNSGCVPSKALLAAAHALTDATAATRFGLGAVRPTVDWNGVRAHVEGVIAAIAPSDSEARFVALGATVLREEARFVAPDALAVGQARLTARRIVIAAGSRTAIPELPGLAAVPYLTHETLFAQPQPPEHLLILGGGPVGLEMAQAHAALGCRVTLVEADRIAGREDPGLVDILRGELRAGGVELREHTAVLRVEAGPVLVLDDGTRLAGSHLLVATGRRPNLEALALDAGGVAASPRGIATDAGLRSTTNRRVYAVGDIADPQGLGPRYFTHVGSYHAAIVVRRALFRLPARLDYAGLPRVIYTAPELAQAGLTEAEARAAGHQVRVLRASLADSDRARTERRTAGLAKLVVTRRGRILGAGFIGPHAGETLGVWTLAISRGIRLSALAQMIVPYPTFAEAGKRAASSFYAEQLFAPASRRIARLLARLR